MSPKTSRNIRLSSLLVSNSVIYSLNGLYYCFIQLYLGQRCEPVTVGYLLALGQLIASLAPLFWGMWADRAKVKNTVLAAALAGAAVFYVAMTADDSVWWLAFTSGAAMVFISPFAGLIDTITLEYCSQENLKYGVFRLGGTVFFSAVVFALSLFIKDDMNAVFMIYSALTVINIAAVFLMPKVHGHPESGKKADIRPIFRDRTLLSIFALIAVASFSWGYYLGFFPAYLTETLGAPEWMWGLNAMVTCAGEVPFFLLFTKLFRKFGVKKILLASAALTALRYVLFGVFRDPWLLILTGAVTGVSITSMTYCGSVYITAAIPDDLHASAQTLMYALAAGVPKIAACICGGYMTESLGARYSMLVCAALSVCALVFAFCTIGRKRTVIAGV